jgi:putative hydroxymethylpyrimidine transport system substrate-binding protein
MARRLFVALGALLAAGCGGSGASHDRVTVSLELDWVPNADHVGVYVGIARGFFAREGVTVAVHAPTDVSDSNRLVAAGRVDLGISYEPEVFLAQQAHLPVVAVATIVPTALNSIIALGSEGIHSPADLRGKTIGEDGTASTAAYVSTVLRSAGLDPSRAVHTLNVGFNLVAALRAGRVDAIAGVFQNIEGVQLALAGLHPVVFPVDNWGVPNYDELVLVANADRLRADPGYRATVARFVRALGQSTNWAKAHPDQAATTLRSYIATGDSSFLDATVKATLPLLAVQAPRASAWASFGRWMYRQRLLNKPPNAAADIAQP